jgi:hypothetical protein
MHRAAFLVVGGFVVVVGLVLLLAPGSYFQLYAVTYVPGMDFPARRFAPAVMALGALLLVARSVPPGPFLATLCLICALAFLGVAATGVEAWHANVARPAILGAAALELVIAGVFLGLWVRMRKL